MLAARVGGAVDYAEADLRGPVAIVLGSEAAGLSDAWSGEDVAAIGLPMLGIADSLNVSIAAAVLLYEARRQRGGPRDGRAATITLLETTSMPSFDFVVIGAGPAGEGAAHKARELGAIGGRDRQALVRRLVPPHRLRALEVPAPSAARHHDGADYSWQRASERRDYMVNRPAGAAEPDDSSHVRALEAAGATTLPRRGPDRGARRRRGHGVDGATTSSTAATSSSRSARGRRCRRSTASPRPSPWTNYDATLTRELPRSLLVLGGGPTGCELAQVFVRFGVPTIVVQSGPRLVPTEHPRNAEVVRFALERDGAQVRTGVRAQRARAGAGTDGAHVVDLDDGSTAEGHTDPARRGARLPASRGWGWSSTGSR